MFYSLVRNSKWSIVEKHSVLASGSATARTCGFHSTILATGKSVLKLKSLNLKHSQQTLRTEYGPNNLQILVYYIRFMFIKDLEIQQLFSSISYSRFIVESGWISRFK